MMIEILLAIILVLLTAILGLLLLNKLNKNSPIIPKVYIINEEFIENDKLKLNNLIPQINTKKSENTLMDSDKEEMKKEIIKNNVEKKDKEKTSEEIKIELKEDPKLDSKEIVVEKPVIQTKATIKKNVIENDEDKSIEDSE